MGSWRDSCAPIIRQVLNAHRYLDYAGWRLFGSGGVGSENPHVPMHSALAAIAIANTLSGYYAQVEAERDSLAARVAVLESALRDIHEMAAEDLRVERVFVCHSFLYQIEANARAALAKTKEDSAK